MADLAHLTTPHSTRAAYTTARPRSPLSRLGASLALAALAAVAGGCSGGDGAQVSPDGTSRVTTASTAEASTTTTPGLPDATPLVRTAGDHYALSVDGSRVAVAGLGAPTTVWELATGTQILSIDESSNRVQFSPDGTLLLTVQVSGTAQSPIYGPVRTWDAATGAQVAQIADEAVLGGAGVAISARGQVAVAGDTSITMYDARTGAPGAVMPITGTPDGLFLSPGGGTLVVNGSNGVQVFDTKSGKLQFAATPSGGGCAVRASSFDHNSRLLLGVDTCAGDIVVWDSLNGAEEFREHDTDHPGAMPAYTPDSELIISCGAATANGDICTMWAAGARIVTGHLPAPDQMPAADAAGANVEVAVSADRASVVVSFDTADATRGTVVIDLVRWVPTRLLPSAANGRASSDSSRIIGVHGAGSDSPEVVVYATADLPRARAAQPDSSGIAIPEPVLVQDGSQFAFAPDDNTVFVGGFGTATMGWTIDDGGSTAALADSSLYLEANNDGTLLLSLHAQDQYTSDGTAQVIDLATGSTLSTIQFDQPMPVRFAPDGDHLIGIIGGAVVVVDARSGNVTRTIAPSSDLFMWAAAPDGEQVAVAPPLVVADVATGAAKFPVEVGDCNIDDVVYSSDGRWIGVFGEFCNGADPGVAFVHSASTGERVVQLNNINSSWQSLAFSPDGSRLLVCGPGAERPDRIDVVELPNGTVVDSFELPEAVIAEYNQGGDVRVLRAEYSQDGSQLLVWYTNLTVVWDVDSHEVVFRTWGLNDPSFSSDGRALAGIRDLSVEVYRL